MVPVGTELSGPDNLREIASITTDNAIRTTFMNFQQFAILRKDSYSCPLGTSFPAPIAALWTCKVIQLIGVAMVIALILGASAMAASGKIPASRADVPDQARLSCNSSSHPYAQKETSLKTDEIDPRLIVTDLGSSEKDLVRRSVKKSKHGDAEDSHGDGDFIRKCPLELWDQ